MMNTTPSDEQSFLHKGRKRQIKPWKCFWLLLASSFVATLLFPYVLQFAINVLTSDQEYTFEKAGQIGDQYGLLNTLFSGIAAAGFFCALMLQNEDIKSQRENSQKERFISETYTRISVFIEKMRDFRYTSVFSSKEEGYSTYAYELLEKDIEYIRHNGNGNENIRQKEWIDIVKGINRSISNVILYSTIVKSIGQSNVSNEHKEEMKSFLNAAVGYSFFAIAAYIAKSPHFRKNKKLRYLYDDKNAILTCPHREQYYASFWKMAHDIISSDS